MLDGLTRQKNSSTDLNKSLFSVIMLSYYVKSPTNSVIQENATKWTVMFKNSWKDEETPLDF